MAKLIKRCVGKLVGCKREPGKKDFSYAIGRIGHIEFHESQNRHPGEAFVRYYFNADGDDLDFTDHYIFTSCGDLDIDGNLHTLRNTRSGSTYVFEVVPAPSYADAQNMLGGGGE